jgi:riboflavin kinase/FMN adenylyltransferase
MKLYRKLTDFPETLRGGALSIGNFDGVHRGHARLVDRLKQFASEMNGAAIVFTFDPHPVRILCPEKAPPPLTWTNRKADLLAELGVDVVLAYPTDEHLLSLTYREFFNQIIYEKLGAQAMVEGPNFYFGRGREGNINTLQELCTENHIRLDILNPVVESGEYISSSRIRELIRCGDVATSRKMLTQPYRIRGMVTHGAARGATMGFPTANLDAIDTLIPAMGVYAGRTYIDGRSHWSAIHIGPNPTFGDQASKVESHLLDFEGSIYGQPVEVDFVARLRDIRQFNSAEDLKTQLEQDVIATRNVARSFHA